ncbi:phosphoribosyltransferase family protein [Actinoplanes sp. URMC 104]|uniref:phosphoribosyltransferase family protein n=1 Tax=Actinoplanes sp. URMC 104 TaxID=3423409 RepID=UPI003F19B435
MKAATAGSRTGGPPWPGAWLSERLPATLTGTAHATLGLALRHNPKRAHLLVSRVLGKHVPVEPRHSLGAAYRLGALVRAQLGDLTEPPLVIGYAETATALGQCVADMLPGASCLHSTRRLSTGVAPVAAFAEEHSHATDHQLMPADPSLLTRGGPVVLVDDELSTGRTAANTIRELHALGPHSHYVVATLVDAAAHERLDALGLPVSVVAAAHARLTLPDNALARGRELAERYAEPPRGPTRHPHVDHLRLPWPAGLPETARHGFHPTDRERLEEAIPTLIEHIPRVRRLLVLGTEELMYTPLRLAAALAERGDRVLFASTTRSPAVPIDQPGYAIRNAITFEAPDGQGARFAYNLAGLDVDAVLLVVDLAVDRERLTTAGGLVPALGAVSDHVIVATVGEQVP